MTPLDLAAFVAFFLLVLGVSFWKGRTRGDADESGYFLGGRSLGWPVIGISIVAANLSSEQMVGMAVPARRTRAWRWRPGS